MGIEQSTVTIGPKVQATLLLKFRVDAASITHVAEL
jgi:hypothetical protein